MKRWAGIVSVTAIFLFFIGCGSKSSPTSVTPVVVDTTHQTTANVVVFDDFSDSINAQNSIGRALGNYKIANLTAAGKDVTWGGGSWYGLASANGALIVSGNGDTVMNGKIETQDNVDLMSTLFSGGRLQAEFNCQNIVPTTADYWAGISCDLAGDLEHPSKFDSLKYPGDSTAYWDLSALDSIRFTMHGTGAVRFSFETKAVDDKFKAKGADAWGFHGVNIIFPDNMTADRVYSIPASSLTMIPDAATEAGGNVTWDQAKSAASVVTLELDTEDDDFLDIDVDKIEFIFKSGAAVPFDFK